MRIIGKAGDSGEELSGIECGWNGWPGFFGHCLGGELPIEI
jgi:hypothetical protein